MPKKIVIDDNIFTHQIDNGYTNEKLAEYWKCSTKTISVKRKELGIPTTHGKKTTQKYNEELLNTSFLCLEDYVNSHTKILHKCTLCSAEQQISPTKVLSGQKCIICTSRKKTNEEYISNLLSTNYSSLQEYMGYDAKILHKCKICSGEFNITPSTVLRNKICSICSSITRALHIQYTDDYIYVAKNTKCQLYLLHNSMCCKIGVTNNISKRLREINRELIQHGPDYIFSVYYTLDTNYYTAFIEENNILNLFSLYKNNISFEGHTECLLLEDKEKIVRYIKEINSENFEKHYDYPYDMHISMKVLSGDAGDGVPGVAGIGHKRAYGLIREYGTAYDIIAALPIPGNQKFIQELNKSKELLMRNYLLFDILETYNEAIGQENINKIKEILKI